MTVVELKEKLVAKIDLINDADLLDQITDFIEFETDKGDIYMMSRDEKDAVTEGISQIENGQWITNGESEKNVTAWLKKYGGQ